MAIQELLSDLLIAGVKLWVDDGRLHFSAPKGVMTPELQTKLRLDKTEIIAYLQKAQQNSLGLRSTELVERPQQIPLSFSQQRQWVEDQLQPGNTANNLFYAFHLSGPLNVTVLEASFQQIVTRHEILRTTFKRIDSQPFQMIAPSLSVSMPIVDIPAKSYTEVNHLAREEAQRPFDLSVGPLMRCTLLRLTETEHILLLTMHHIISDGWSIGVLFREIVLLSQAYLAGNPSPLPDLPLQYADFSIWQRNWLQGNTLRKQMAYWKEQLAGAVSLLDLPTDRIRPAIQAHRGARLSFALSQALSDDLQKISRQEDVTLFMILLAAFQTLLSCYSQQAAIAVGVPVANRNRPELEGLIGFFANTLILRTNLSGDPDFREIIQQVQQVCIGAYDHPDIPFEKLVDELQIEYDPSHNPLFQVMFNLQNSPVNPPNFAGLTIKPLEIDRNTTHFDLRISLQETPKGLAGFLKYNTDLFDQDTILLLIELYRQILQGWVDNPAQHLSEICLSEALTAKVKAARALQLLHHSSPTGFQVQTTMRD